MSIRRARKTMPLPLEVALLGIAAPQVIAQRLARIAIAGASPSASDRKEFARMSFEKIAAVHQSWNAMSLHAVQAYQQWVMSWMVRVWFPWSFLKVSMKRATLDPGAVQALGKTIAPFRRRAVANAKRLSRARRE